MPTFDFTGFSSYSQTSGSSTPSGLSGGGTYAFEVDGVQFTYYYTVFSTGGVGGGTISFHAGASGISLQVNAPSTVNYYMNGTLSFSTTPSMTGWTPSVSVDVSGSPSGWSVNQHTTMPNVLELSFSSDWDTSFYFNSVTGNFQCFCAGTGIATPSGPRAVETLQQGDKLLTSDGGETTVKWLGRQDVPVRYLHPAKINPICIKAGALADGVPARDLYISQDHAIAIDGLLINAGALVNGHSIYQVGRMPLRGFTYYHVETDAHELILAENVPAESFIDYAGYGSFDNGSEREDAPPIPEMDLPRVSARRLLPEPIRARLMARSGSGSPQALAS